MGGYSILGERSSDPACKIFAISHGARSVVFKGVTTVCQKTRSGGNAYGGGDGVQGAPGCLPLPDRSMGGTLSARETNQGTGGEDNPDRVTAVSSDRVKPVTLRG